MTLNEFYTLKSEKQMVYILDHGQFLMKRSDAVGVRVRLYHCGTFFAELFYNTKTNAILSHRAFKSDKLLEPYLEQIKLSEIQ